LTFLEGFWDAMAATSPQLIKKVLPLLRKHGALVRFSEALKLGIHRDTLWAMRDQGLLEQVSRGLYRLADREPLEQPDLVTVSCRVPGAVVCLVSALSLHELTTQIPHAVDIALKQGRRRPHLEHPPIRVYWCPLRPFGKASRRSPTRRCRSPKPSWVSAASSCQSFERVIAAAGGEVGGGARNRRGR